jgi:hypothetical protein
LSLKPAAVGVKVPKLSSKKSHNDTRSHLSHNNTLRSLGKPKQNQSAIMMKNLGSASFFDPE